MLRNLSADAGGGAFLRFLNEVLSLNAQESAHLVDVHGLVRSSMKS